MNPPKGCPFAARCGHTMKVCQEYRPDFTEFEEGHTSACWLHDPRCQPEGEEQ